MNHIPTAEEFVKQYQKGSDYFCITKGEAISKLKEFAKLHVKAALKKASETYAQGSLTPENSKSIKESILNSYPDELIK